MAILELPVRSDLAAYNFTIDLEGTKYLFRFRFNYRLGLWVLDLATTVGANLIAGVAVQTNVDLIGRYTLEGRPPGRLLAYDETGNEADATRDNFGVDVKLLYQESTA